MQPHRVQALASHSTINRETYCCYGAVIGEALGDLRKPDFQNFQKLHGVTRRDTALRGKGWC